MKLEHPHFQRLDGNAIESHLSHAYTAMGESLKLQTHPVGMWMKLEHPLFQRPDGNAIESHLSQHQ